LAQLSFQAFQRGDNATAATLARVLERTWDTALAAEEGKIIAQLQEEVREVLDERFLQLSIEVLTLKTHEVFLDAGENCVQRNLAAIIKWSSL
jgi:hypothetical protein